VNRHFDTGAEESHSGTSSQDREISLGTPTILGIFFALALVCAMFFGFGYSLGRKSTQNAAVSISTTPTAASLSAKPTAGSLAGQPRPAIAETQPEPVVVPISASKNGVTPADAMIVGDKLPAGSQPPVPAISPAGTFMVQIAAVSSQDIADIELAALKKYGYEVVARHESQDQLLHIQIGPFSTRKDAEAMRANVQAHGFNAIVK
jgi:DedD protein